MSAAAGDRAEPADRRSDVRRERELADARCHSHHGSLWFSIVVFVFHLIFISKVGVKLHPAHFRASCCQPTIKRKDDRQPDENRNRARAHIVISRKVGICIFGRKSICRCRIVGIITDGRILIIWNNVCIKTYAPFCIRIHLVENYCYRLLNVHADGHDTTAF